MKFLYAGLQSRDFTSVDTLCAVLVDAVRRQVTCEGPVNLAFGGRTDLLGLIKTLKTVLGQPLQISHEEARKGDVRHTEADLTLLRSLFPGVEPARWPKRCNPPSSGSKPRAKHSGEGKA